MSAPHTGSNTDEVQSHDVVQLGLRKEVLVTPTVLREGEIEGE